MIAAVEIAVGFGAAVVIPSALYWLTVKADASGEIDLCAAITCPPCVPPAASAGAASPVALTPDAIMLDAKTRLSLGSSCRRAAVAFAVQADQLGRRALATGAPYPPEAMEASQRAFDLEAAAQLLQDEAQDADLHAYLAHRAAGGMVVLKDAAPAETIVVGDAPLTATAVNDRPSWFAAATRRLRRSAA